MRTIVLLLAFNPQQPSWTTLHMGGEIIVNEVIQIFLTAWAVFQSVTPHLSLGGEVFWAGQHRKSGIGYAARYNTDKMV